ncbi:hypothetical protein IAR55_002231 [Kwoniella newhampshirensis]|uniref:Uncharacterized protein n=1 Tax=Kwoniella newhampshirensis TaxID=1651941 RepID=A0AAW0YR07_9TREE
MEAVRPEHDRNQFMSQSTSKNFEDTDDLPAPPTPFPTELIAPPSTSAQSKQIRQHLSSVQTSCVQALTSLLPSDETPTFVVSASDAQYQSQLAGALTELLQVTYQLEDLMLPSPDLSQPPLPVPLTASSQTAAPTGEETTLDTLAGHLSSLQSARNEAEEATPSSSSSRIARIHPTISAVREKLAWARLESLSHAVTELARGRSRSAEDPPSYEQHHDHPTDGNRSVEVEGHHNLPEYQELEDTEVGAPSGDKGQSERLEEPKEDGKDQDRSSLALTPHPAQREKMLHDLDAVTSAIERLYSVAPQYNDQRVESRGFHSDSNLPERRSGHDGMMEQDTTLNKAEKIRMDRLKMKELEEIWKLIERTHGKGGEIGQKVDGEEWNSRSRERFLDRLVAQTENGRMEDQDSATGTVNADLARARDLRNRDDFLRDLVEHSAEGRLNGQDADFPRGDRVALWLDKREAFLNEIPVRTRASRLESQEYPLSIEDKLQEKRSSLIDSLMDYSSSGRLQNQDSLPPALRRQSTVDGEVPSEFVTLEDFFTGRKGSLDDRTIQNDAQGVNRSRSNSVPLIDGQRLSAPPKASRRLAGLIRRGSSHLGSKASAGLDDSNVSYVAEHQEHLRTVQVILYGPGLVSNLDLVLETPRTTATDVERQAVVMSTNDPSFSHRVVLPVPVSSCQAVSFVPRSDHLEARLSALPTPPANVTIAPTHALSATDLRTLQPRSICCTICDREFANVSHASAQGEAGYKDLPSEHWAEMIEIWMCHDDPAFTKGLAEKTKLGFWPRDGGVLVGGSYLLIEGDKASMSNLIVDASVKSETWNTLLCRCGEVVGKQRSRDEKPGQGTIKLSKWAISLLKDGHQSTNDSSEIVIPVRFPLSVFVISDMLELAQAHASYRFVIAEDESGDARVYIWLFNPSIRLSYPKSKATPSSSPLRASFSISDKGQDRRSSRSRRSSLASSVGMGVAPSHSLGESKVLRAAKVMYKIVDLSNNVSSENLPGFGPGGQVETLSYSRDVCSRLIAILRESTWVYPVQRRTMGAFDIGFLERT